MTATLTVTTGDVRTTPRPAMATYARLDLRRQLRDLAATLGARDLDRLLTFAEFVKARRVARSYTQRHDASADEAEARPSVPSAPPSGAPAEEVHASAHKTLPS